MDSATVAKPLVSFSPTVTCEHLADGLTTPADAAASVYETDDHVAPKELEEPEIPWFLREADEHPQQEPDDYDPERDVMSDWSDDRDDLEDDQFHVSLKTIRQPATDILFDHREIGGELEITTAWKANIGKTEKTRLSLMARTDDLKPFSKHARRQMGRFREKGEGKYSLNDRLSGDKWSAGGRKLQVALRSMIAAASVRYVPDDAVLFVTVNYSATPELPIWEKAGGPGPLLVVEDGKRRFQKAIEEVGAEHWLCEGFFEVAQAINAADKNERCAEYAKAYAREDWPEGLSWDEHSNAICVEHTHRMAVLVDKDGQFVSADRLKEALKRQFPLPRAVCVETARETRWGNPDASVAEKVAAFIRYNLTKERPLTELEVLETLRWTKELTPEHIFNSGWTSLVDVRPMAVPIVRASLLGRHKLQDALPDFDIGPGRRVEVSSHAAPEPVEAREASGVVICLDDYRRSHSGSVSRPEPIVPLRSTDAATAIANAANVIRSVDVRDLKRDRATQRFVIVSAANDNELPASARASPIRRAA